MKFPCHLVADAGIPRVHDHQLRRELLHDRPQLGAESVIRQHQAKVRWLADANHFVQTFELRHREHIAMQSRHAVFVLQNKDTRLRVNFQTEPVALSTAKCSRERQSRTRLSASRWSRQNRNRPRLQVVVPDEIRICRWLVFA